MPLSADLLFAGQHLIAPCGGISLVTFHDVNHVAVLCLILCKYIEDNSLRLLFRMYMRDMRRHTSRERCKALDVVTKNPANKHNQIILDGMHITSCWKKHGVTKIQACNGQFIHPNLMLCNFL